jgi:hypothetical protein
MSTNTIPTLYLEQLLLDELTDEKREKIISRPETELRLDELKDSNKTILDTYPAEMMVERINTKLNNAYTPFFRKYSYPIAAAAALLLVFTGILPVVLNKASIDNSTPTEITRVKGLRSQLHVYRETESQPEQLSEGDLVREHDLLQISYLAGEKSYGIIFSIDGRGAVTLHFPDIESSSPKLYADGEIPLPYSYELDDAPNFERFFFIVSDEKITLDDILEEAGRLAEDTHSSLYEELILPEGLEQLSVTLFKEEQ